MQSVGLVLRSAGEQELNLARRIAGFIKQTGRDVLIEASCLESTKIQDARLTDSISDEADLLVVLGGDGTILRAASLLNSKPVPVLGVNLGRIGYMAEIAPDEAIDEIEAVFDGRADIANRMLLEVTLPDGTTHRFLNDAVIHWGVRARLIDLGVRIGGGREIEIRADGLIVSTPNGSSAYSYAAYGPLVHPDIEATLLTPICPFSGLRRPLLIPADFDTFIRLRKGEHLTLTLDGHTTVPLEAGQSIRIVRSPLTFALVRSRARDYFSVLEEKLGLL